MAIVAGDIDFRLSGGAANSDPDAALGGAKSSTELTDATLENLFSNAPAAESEAGSVKYRCFYVHNNHGSLALQNAEIWISANTPSGDTVAAIGLGTSAVNGTEQTVADEDTAPSGVTFSSADGQDNALSIGNIPADEHKAIWVRRTISAGAGAYNPDNMVINVEGETAA